MTPEEKLKELGITLTDVPKRLGSYMPCVQSGNLLFLSGMLPLKDGRLIKTGRLGETVSIEEGQECSRQAVMNALSVLKSYLKSLDNISRCIKVNGYVASADNFTEQPKVINGASDFLFEVLGEKGKHARAAVGVAVLPLNAPVEIDFIFEILPY